MTELNQVQLEEVNGGVSLFAVFSAGWELGKSLAQK